MSIEARIQNAIDTANDGIDFEFKMNQLGFDVTYEKHIYFSTETNTMCTIIDRKPIMDDAVSFCSPLLKEGYSVEEAFFGDENGDKEDCRYTPKNAICCANENGRFWIRKVNIEKKDTAMDINEMFKEPKKEEKTAPKMKEFNEIDVCISAVEENIQLEKETDGEIVYRGILKRDLAQSDLIKMTYKLKEHYIFDVQEDTEHLFDDSITMGKLLSLFENEKSNIIFNRTTIFPLDLDNALRDCTKIIAYIYSTGTKCNSLEELKQFSHPEEDIKLSFIDNNGQPRDVYLTRSDDKLFHQSHIKPMTPEQFEKYLKRGIENVKSDETDETPESPLKKLKKTDVVENTAKPEVVANSNVLVISQNNLESLANTIIIPKEDITVIPKEDVTVMPKEDTPEVPKKALKTKTVDKTSKTKKRAKKVKNPIKWDRKEIMKRAARIARDYSKKTGKSYRECIGEAIRESWRIAKEEYTKKTGKVAPRSRRSRKYRTYDRRVIANKAWALAKKSVKSGVMVSSEDIRAAYKTVLKPYLLYVDMEPNSIRV